MRKILHVGTHKTATTSFQACLRNNRADLLKQGLIFPDLSKVGLHDSVGHHSLIGLLASKPEKGRSVASRVIKSFSSTADDDAALLISSERCYRHAIGLKKDEKPRQRRRNFVNLLAETFGADTEVAIVLRRPDSYAESSYQETIKKTNRTDTIQSFWDSPGVRMRLDYRFQLRLFQKAFERVNVFIYEDLIQAPDGPEMALLRGLGLNVALASPPERRNTSLHAYLTEYKRLMNYQKLPPAQLKNLIERLLEIQRAGEFDWMTRKMAFLGLTRRREIMGQYEEDLKWIVSEFFAEREMDLFPEPAEAHPVFERLPIDVFEMIHQKVCETLSDRALFYGPGEGMVERGIRNVSGLFTNS
ncbi:hypothetical protein [Amaricoccus tamworthensis]|uniref:hypothetical protein n=1 Tax=Amaricoccus tamworthensis TaxID=57002 RepID=UPI003C7A8E96